MSVQPSDEQIGQEIYEHAASLVLAGKSRAEVEADLTSRGIDHEGASAVANNLFHLRAKALKKAGQKNMLYGVLWCIGGIVVTAVTYGAASGSRG